jgi:hypothetical protein
MTDRSIIKVISKLNVATAMLLVSLFLLACNRETPKNASAPPPVPPKPALTAAQRIEEAKKALATDYSPNKDMMKAKWGRVADAETHIKQIASFESDAQKEEVESINKEIARRRKEIDKVAAIAAQQMAIEKRRSVAKELDKIFLDNNMDVKIEVEGKSAEVLKLTWILWSRVTVHKFTTENGGSFLSNMQSQGFKRVYFRDGYDYGVYYDL